ncbi:MAG: transposase [Candidatus Baltobacteraceae bacterium]
MTIVLAARSTSSQVRAKISPWRIPVVTASVHKAQSRVLRKTARSWSLTALREKLIKIGAKVVSHGRYVAFQMAEVAIPRRLFAAIVERIAALRSSPVAMPA